MEPDLERILSPIPIVLYLTGTAAAGILFYEIGYRIGCWHRRKGEEAEVPQAGTVAAAALGLFAFMLAFTFNLAGQRFEHRKLNVIEEANAIGTAWLRAEHLPSPQSLDSKELLLEYVEIRQDPQDLSHEKAAYVLERSDEIHRTLWEHATAAAVAHPRSIPIGLYIDALNRVIDFHTKRFAVAAYHRIAPSIWYALFFIGALTLTLLGVHGGLNGNRGVMLAILLSTSLAAVVVLIADLDRPVQRLFGVSQQPIVDLYQTMRTENDR